MKILGIIPARAGSKGIPQKNIKNFNGKPLISWTIETALGCPLISETIVSTESQEIADIAKSYGASVPFMRPSDLAKDSTPGIEPVLHAIQQLSEYDWILVLQPTSPLRTVDDICGIINLVKDKKASSAVSVSEAINHPYWSYTLEKGKLLSICKNEIPLLRQDLPPAYNLNGALYLASRNFLEVKRTIKDESTLAYVMPRHRSVDIDDIDDWNFAEYLIKKKTINK